MEGPQNTNQSCCGLPMQSHRAIFYCLFGRPGKGICLTSGRRVFQYFMKQNNLNLANLLSTKDNSPILLHQLNAFGLIMVVAAQANELHDEVPIPPISCQNGPGAAVMVCSCLPIQQNVRQALGAECWNLRIYCNHRKTQ